MPGIALVTTHTATGLRRLLEQYRDKLQFNALLASYLQEVQELENATWEVYTERLFANAVGVQLDMLGKLVGESRQGRTDNIYRAWIRIRINVNKSQGKEMDIRGILDLTFNDYVDALISFLEVPPAYFVIGLKSDPEIGAGSFLTTFTGTDAAKLVKQAKAAGVGFAIYQLTGLETENFEMKNLGDVDDPLKAFGDSVSGGVGGLASHVYQG